jgi:hypothetical protein
MEGVRREGIAICNVTWPLQLHAMQISSRSIIHMVRSAARSNCVHATRQKLRCKSRVLKLNMRRTEELVGEGPP